MATVSATTALDATCSPLHVTLIAEDIEDWEELAPYFGLTPAEEQTIRADHSHQYKLQKRKMLWMWVEKNGKKATYRRMKEIFSQAKKELLADKLEEILHDPYSQSPLTAVTAFKRYLKDCYARDGEAVGKEPRWPPLSNAPFVNPELVLGDQKVSRKVRISDLFEGKKAHSVLLEGTAGSGKTTPAVGRGQTTPWHGVPDPPDLG